MHTDITPHTLPLILLINLLKYLFIVHCIAPPPLGLSESVLFDEAGRSRTSLNSSSIELLSTRLCNVSPSFLHPLRTGKTLVTIPVGGCSISRGAINISISRYYRFLRNKKHKPKSQFTYSLVIWCKLALTIKLFFLCPSLSQSLLFQSRSPRSSFLLSHTKYKILLIPYFQMMAAVPRCYWSCGAFSLGTLSFSYFSFQSRVGEGGQFLRLSLEVNFPSF